MLFSDGTPSEKYFSVGIRIFLWVFARTEKCEIPVVIEHDNELAINKLIICNHIEEFNELKYLPVNQY